ncbi:MAG TPA: glycosyltransferase [Nitrospiraceae bacterium]|nr:glycosyltransferase [Nitrospiraceae bacterium]
MTATRVSVIIPTYNQDRYLGDAIESALAQTRLPEDIIVIDNGSTDRTPEVAARYPVRYIRQTNQGICGSTNRGIAEATGDYVVILHSDDRLLPHHVETNLAAFAAHPDTAFVCGDYRWLGPDDCWHVHRCEPLPDYYGTLLRLNFIGPPIVVMFRRDVLLAVGGFRREFEGADDQEVYLRIARQYPIHCHHRVIAEYRRHPSQGSQKLIKMLAAAIRTLQAQRPHLGNHPEYRVAYRAGIRQRQGLYGQAIFWQALRAAKARQWSTSLACAAVLVQYDRKDLIGPLYQRFFGMLKTGEIKPSLSRDKPFVQ